MTGFRLSWRIDTPSLIASISKQGRSIQTLQYEKFLHDVVHLARDLRLQNMTKEEILKEVIRQKSQMRVIPELDDKCMMEQVGFYEYEDVFSTLVFNANKNQTSKEPSEKDIETGHELFHAVVFCPSMIFKMFTFVDQLLSGESSRTIIQAIVHLLQCSAILDRTSFTLAKRFYRVLASTLDLQYGNILLSASSKAHRKTAISQGLPFFLNHTDRVDKCLQGSNCDTVQDIIQNTGMFFFCCK